MRFYWVPRMLTFADSVVPSIALKGLEFLLLTRTKIRSTILVKIGGIGEQH
jgi:hypothetical protein